MRISPLKKKKESRIPLAMAFLLPFVTACIVFALAGLYPFGDDTILAHDGRMQYFPFFSAFREKLLTGGSLQYTWNVGMGTGYASLFAYYLASPLNWLCIAVPSSALTEFFALLTIVKISCAGLFMALFFKIVYRKNDISIAFFGLLYAFCSWVCGYYWNNIWLDTFALLPLLVAGTVCLLRDGKFRLYVIALALSLWCNYYLSYICCVFVFLSFVVYCIVCWRSWKSFLRRFLRIGVCTLLGFGLAAVLLIPTLKAMANTYAAGNTIVAPFAMNFVSAGTGKIPGLWSASTQILSNLMPTPSITDILPAGLPNIYCGFSTVILALYFCCCSKITLREKLCNVFLLFFLLLSFVFQGLNYFWHGFHFPNGLPYRFSFLFSFVTICMAYRAYTLMDGFKKWYLLIIVPIAGLLIWNACGAEGLAAGSITMAVIVLCAMIAFFLTYGDSRIRRIASTVILMAVIACEMISCFRLGVEQVHFTARADYPKDGEAVQLLLEKVDELEDGNTPFWRTETTVTQSRNDGALNNYHGASVFTSSANVNFNRFSPALGLSSLLSCNWYVYNESPPFSNTMCGIKYLLDREGQFRDPKDNTLIATEGNTNLLRNDSFISLGFMTESELADFAAEEETDNPIREQNDLFCLATGVHEPLYTPVPCEQAISWNEGSTIAVTDNGTQFSYSCVGTTERTTFGVIYRAPSDALYCATTSFPDISTVYIYRNGESICDRYIKSCGMFSLGRLAAGDEIMLVYFVDPGWQGSFYADVEMMDDIAYQRGLAELADEPWELTEVTDTKLTGSVTARKDGLFYTSVPYEPGWTATVDGEEVELAATFDPSNPSVKLTDAVISFPLSAGTHTVTLSYSTPGLTAGCLLSVAALLLFGGLIYLRRKDDTLFPDPPEEMMTHQDSTGSGQIRTNLLARLGKNEEVRTMKSSPLKKKKEDRMPLALAFLIPFSVACIVFAIAGLYPFGDSMILAHDEWHQYYPFFSAFRDKLLSGGSLQYTWNIGMGTGYASLFAYYLASPLNWLCILVPSSVLTEFFALLTILKISCAGLFFALFLKIVYRRNDSSIAFFAMMYAFCSWVCGYYWNNIWLDTFALLPLLVAGTVCLLRDGKFRLYVIALALSLWCNYYIAYFSCIFVLLSFIVYCIVCWQGFLNFLRRFLRIGICTLLGFGLAAAILLPTLKAMEITYSAKSNDVAFFGMNIATGVSGTVPEGQSLLGFLWKETLPGLWEASKKIFTNLMPIPSITKMEGLPNVYCGFSALILSLYFCCCRKIRLREKLCNVFLLLFLLLSFIFRYLDYIWHGFHFPNMLPYRFSFLFSFVTICMAYRAYTLMDEFKTWYLFIIVPIGGLLIWNAYGAEEIGLKSLVAAVLVLGGMVAFFLVYGKTRMRRTLSSAILMAVIACEMISCFSFGVRKVSVTTRTGYPKDGEAVQLLLEKIEEQEKGKTTFWRTEATNTHTLNDGALNGYNGVSIFTSSANVNFNRFSRSLGTSSWPGSNRFVYYESSPFVNAMCGIKYLLDRDGQYRDTQYNTLIATEGSTNLLRNDYFISLGFMADSQLADFVAEEEKYNPIWEQNDMFRLATGLQEPLYTPLPYEQLIASDENSTIEASGTSGTQYSYNCVNASERSSYSVIYRAPVDGLYCATTKFTGVNNVSAYHNGEYLFERNIKARSMFSLGWFAAGDEIKLVYFIDAGGQGTFSADVELMNDSVFRRGHAELADEPWELTKVTDTTLTGIITARQDGLFYTSVPYEPGWTATVDGEEVELAATFDPSNPSVKLTDAVVSFPLSAGTHAITLHYSAPGLTTGWLISASALLLFGGLLYLRRKEYTLFPDPEEE